MEKKVVKKKVAAPKKAVAPKKTTAAKKPAASGKTHTFSLHAAHARSVEVVGDFNKWEIGKHPMKKDAKGLWKKAVVVKPGRYQYKYLVDGEWWLDPEKETAPNSFGTENNVFTV
jgi:1,4-alpha-glucan branching enzyme